MSLEKPQNFEIVNMGKHKFFEEVYKEILEANGDFIEYQENFSKEEFLDYLVRDKNVLLHGSNDSNIQELESRQANCRSKKFGNMKGVYAVNDSVIPIFYSIIDKNRFEGTSVSAIDTTIDEKGTAQKKYHFAMNKNMLNIQPWSEGAVYILPKESFEQGTDDAGNLIEEWMSKVSIKPLAKLKILPNDFRFLSEVEAINDD